MRRWIALSMCAVALSVVAGAIAAASYSDSAGDNNAAPDVTSVTVSESPEGTLTVTVAIANYQTLPADSAVSLWFDLDNNLRTGDEGDESLVQYQSNGIIDFYRWNGRSMARVPATGMAGTFAAGVFIFTGPKTAFDSAASFGVLVIAARRQEIPVLEEELVASDFAPETGHVAYVAPGPLTFADPAGDHDAAPDITSVNVSDTRAGMVTFAVATPSHLTLSKDTWIELDVDLDRRESTGAAGSEVYVYFENGRVFANRWSPSEDDFVEVAGSGVKARSADGVVTFDVPRKFLEDVASFNFYLVSGDYDAETEENTGIDLAPNGDAWWKYTLVNKAPVRLIAGPVSGSPAQPRNGRPFTISLPVRRSDTGRPITSGTVTCNVLAAAKKVPAKGAVKAGRGTCTILVPKTAYSTVRGSMTVRSGGKSVTTKFAFRIRVS